LCLGRCSAAQSEAKQLIDLQEHGGSLVSVNQLRTPRKALKAVQKAQEKLLAGRVSSAEKKIASALALAPDCGLAHDVLGVVLLERGQYQEAVEAFQTAIDQDPTLASAFIGSGISLLLQGRFRDALRPLDQGEKRLPDSWLAHFESSIAYLGAGELDVALHQIVLAENLSGSDHEKRSGVSFLRALVHLNRGDRMAARHYLTDAISRDPDGPYARLSKQSLRRVERISPVDQRPPSPN